MTEVAPQLGGECMDSNWLTIWKNVIFLKHTIYIKKTMYLKKRNTSEEGIRNYLYNLSVERVS